MAKQLFNSSEKSNFILNLTKDGYSKLAAVCLIIAFFATSLTTAIPVFTEKAIYSISAVGLAVSGVFSMIVALIGAMKKYIDKKMTLPFILLGVMLLMGLISMFNSYDMRIGFYGYTGRDEGFLTLMYYVCFFAAAACIKNGKSLKTLLIGIVSAGLLNSAVALIQVFAGKFSFYKMASLNEKINAASGLAQSPLFLAMLLSLALIAALFGVISFKGKGQKVFCGISACIFSFVMIFTYSFIGICGLAVSAVMAVIAVFALKAPKLSLLSVLTVIAPAAAAIGIISAGVVGNISSFKLYDGYNLWISDAYIRLSASGLPDDNVDIGDVYDVYYTLNRKSLDIISGAPLTGTGPDQVVFPQLYTYGTGGEDSPLEDVIQSNKGTFDRVYNEYLNTAASRGVISAAALVFLLLTVIVQGIRNFKRCKSPESLCMTLLTVTGALLFLIGCSNTAFSPIFWAICGASCAVTDKEKSK